MVVLALSHVTGRLRAGVTTIVFAAAVAAAGAVLLLASVCCSARDRESVVKEKGTVCCFFGLTTFRASNPGRGLRMEAESVPLCDVQGPLLLHPSFRTTLCFTQRLLIAAYYKYIHTVALPVTSRSLGKQPYNCGVFAQHNASSSPRLTPESTHKAGISLLHQSWHLT